MHQPLHERRWRVERGRDARADRGAVAIAHLGSQLLARRDLARGVGLALRSQQLAIADQQRRARRLRRPLGRPRHVAVELRQQPALGVAGQRLVATHAQPEAVERDARR